MTRRNDRRLRTSSGETVRNRDRWTVTATHPDGALTVSQLGGHGTVTLPADYVAEHVRLGYAATEHGHQGDTVDVGIALVSAATTHRGLYVGATRGRDDNRIHVITDTDDLAEARDVLDGVLAHDRADVPAVTQRRHLAQTDGPTAGTRTRAARCPDWIEPWRQQTRRRRRQLTDRRLDQQTRNERPAPEARRRSNPPSRRARRAWEPYARPIRRPPTRAATPSCDPACGEPTTKPAPPRWATRADAQRRAADASRSRPRSPGRHRRHPRRRSAASSSSLDQLDTARRATLQAQPNRRPTRRLRPPARSAELDQILDATDTYTDWLDGRPIPTARLAHAVDTLTDVRPARPVLRPARPARPDPVVPAPRPRP